MRWDELLAFPFWAITFYMLRPSVLRQAEWRKPAGLLARLFTITAALSLTFQIDGFALRFDQAIGNRNLSWLLAYILGVVTTYCGFSAWVWVRENHLPSRAAVLAVVTIILLVVAFPPFAALPEIPHSASLDTLAQADFRLILYLFMGAMAIEGLLMLKQFLRNEKLPTGRLRIGLLIVSLYVAVGFVLLRLFDGIALLSSWSTPLNSPAWAFGNLLIVICILGFALAFAPLTWFRVFARFFMFVEQQQIRRDLEKLRDQLVRLTGPLPWPQPKRHERWLHPSHAIYCLLIDILDRRTFLLARLQTEELAIARPVEVNSLLADLPETDDWIELLHYVRRIARGDSSLRQKKRNES